MSSCGFSLVFIFFALTDFGCAPVASREAENADRADQIVSSPPRKKVAKLSLEF